MPNKTIGFDPILNQPYFKTIWSLDCGWGVYEKTEAITKITIKGGHLAANKIRLPYMKDIKTVTVDGEKTAFSFENGILCAAADGVQREIIIE